MGYNKQDYIRVKAEFSEKYLAAQARATERRMEVYARVPEVRSIDAVLSRTGMDVLAAINGAQKDAEEKIAQIRARNDELLKQRAALLVAAGLPADYSDVRYECEKCGDTGFVNTKMCDCMRRALIEAGYESSGLGALIRTQSFENFSFQYYREGGADADMIQKSVAGLKRFSDEFGRETYRNYLLIGGTGLGKTHLSTAVAKNVIERGFDVLYVTAVSMVRDFEAKQFDKGVGVKIDPERYEEADLLIIDDLGTEMTNQFTLTCLYDVINERINRHRSTIINTNLAFRELEARYHERITSRLFGEYQPILFKGIDIRKQKIQRNQA
jgi:DNA replication protein DnaC